MWLYRVNRGIAPVLKAYWRLRFVGPEQAVPLCGPLLIAANHTSYLDPWFIGMVVPRPVRYLITRSWYDRSPAWRALFRAWGTAPLSNEGAEATIDEVCARLARGDVVGVFPEGRISPDGRLQRFRPGLARMAARSGAPVLPIGIRGARESLPKHRRIPRPTRVTIHCGEPLFFPGAPMADTPRFELRQEFLDRVTTAICDLSGQPIPTRDESSPA